MDQSTANKKPSGESWRNEPVQPKQKALLEFLKMPLPPTRGGAHNFIKAVFESPAGYAHQKVWKVARYQLHPDLYAPKLKKKLPVPKSPSLLGFLFKTALLLAVIFYIKNRYSEPAVSPSSTQEPIVTTPTVAVKHDPPPPAPKPKPASDIISLQNTDGRTVQARILALTKTTVLIRREDGQTFDLPLDQLTDDSKDRIDEYRTAKRTGLLK